MDEFEDDLERLAAAGLSRRRSSTVAPPLRLAGHSSKRSSVSSGSGSSEGAGLGGKTNYRVLVLGAAKVGKTSIISQFLYDQLPARYKPTVEEMYRGEFEIKKARLALDIEDTSGNFASDFPAMVGISLAAADAVVLVFSLDDKESFEKVVELRDLVIHNCGEEKPVVVVGNKLDSDNSFDTIETEALVQCDWEHGYVECSARRNENIQEVFKELLVQVRKRTDILPSSLSNCSSSHCSPVSMRRRQSLPAVPAFSMDGGEEGRRREGRRRSSLAVVMGRQTCKIS